MAAEELVVEIPEDLNAEIAAPEKEGKEEAPKKVEKDESPLAAQVAAMKQREKDAETARFAAENRARQESEARQRAEADNLRLSREASVSTAASITNAIAAKTAEVAQAEDQYRIAMESGNFGEAAKVQTRLSKAAALLATLERDREIADLRKPGTTEGQVRQQIAPPDVGDPIDNHINSLQVGDRAKNWLREHKDCLTDRAKNNLMMAAHYEAVGKGLSEGGDSYFAHLEEKLGYRDGEDGGEEVEVEVQPAPKPVKRVLAAAPVSRDSAHVNGGSKATTKVTLTSDEREAADFSGISYAEYARQKLIALKNGDFERTN